MTTPESSPYGSWESPITADWIVAEAIALGNVALSETAVYWTEGRPAEGGRQTVMCRHDGGEVVELTPAPLYARTRVHEYGGVPYLVAGDMLYFIRLQDQQVYAQALTSGEAHPLTDAPGRRFAELHLDTARGRLLAVCEDHTVGSGKPSEVVNTLVSIQLDTGDVREQVAGGDFYAAPRLSPDGTRLLWLTWNHPNMPWDGTELWLADLHADGTVARAERIAGGDTESIPQAEWAPDGSVVFLSDRTGWWNFYRWRGGTSEPLCPMEAEFGQPMWLLGRRSFGFVGPEQLLCAYTVRGRAHLATLDLGSGQLLPIEMPYDVIAGLDTVPGRAVLLVGSASEPLTVALLDVATGEWETLRQATEQRIPENVLSRPDTIEFPTEGGRTAFGFFYRPRNDRFAPPPNEQPPLIVRAHGGPTGATVPLYNPSLQFWTSRGFAVLDVNYGGSTGYGRAYRQRLDGQWGIVDVDDCVAGARFLVEQGEVDGARLAITGGSAGGYTVLCALTFRDTFHTGASHFGISDLESMTEETHKFESRYLDRLIGPYPERLDLYRERSALHHIEQLNRPLILFQGLEDLVVPPNQAETIFQAVRAKGLPVAYLAFEGEDHGFRRADTIRRVLEAELAFYAQLFAIEPADDIEPVAIENLGRS